MTCNKRKADDDETENVITNTNFLVLPRTLQDVHLQNRHSFPEEILAKRSQIEEKKLNAPILFVHFSDHHHQQQQHLLHL